MIAAARRMVSISSASLRSRSSCTIVPGSTYALGRDPAAPHAPARGLDRGEHLALELLVRAQLDERARRADQIVGQPLRQLLDRVGRVDAERLGRRFDAQPLAVPDLALAVARAQEQHGPLARVLRREHEQRLGLAEAGQVVEVGVGAVGVLGVGVAQRVRRGREEHDALAEPFEHRRAPPREGVHPSRACRKRRGRPAGRPPCRLVLRRYCRGCPEADGIGDIWLPLIPLFTGT